MGGDAGAHSVPGKGSTFWFSVVLERSAVDASISDKPAASVHEEIFLDGITVLVTDDEPLNREMVAALLEEIGVHVDMACNGIEAVTKARERRYDLILMDMQMPLLDGLDATRQIRALPEGGAVPIVAMTANAFAEDRKRCLAVGMDDFITKPFDPDRLFEKIRSIASQNRS